MSCCSIKVGRNVSGLSDHETVFVSRAKPRGLSGFHSSFSSLAGIRRSSSKKTGFPALSIDFSGTRVAAVSDRNFDRGWGTEAAPANFSPRARASISVSRAMRWWEKTPKPNMLEISSSQQLVDSLVNAGDKLVVIDFYSPGCGGCKAVHPKICQLAESNPDAIFLKVNYEELKTMCECLHIHVLPFFRFYRGAEGRLCSFSCTNATIKKFKDALAKHGRERCSIGPTKGLEHSELVRLAECGEIKSLDLPLALTTMGNQAADNLVTNGINTSGGQRRVVSDVWIEQRTPVLNV